MPRKSQNVPDSPELWTRDEAAKYLKMNPETVRIACATGELKAYKIGKSWRIKPADVDAWLEANSNTHYGVGRRKAS